MLLGNWPIGPNLHCFQGNKLISLYLSTEEKEEGNRVDKVGGKGDVKETKGGKREMGGIKSLVCESYSKELKALSVYTQ